MYAAELWGELDEDGTRVVNASTERIRVSFSFSK